MNKKPNILFLFTDQQRFDTIHALGNERIITPALDEIANSAVVFDCCYTPAPVCVPARFSLFPGKYPAHTGCCNNNASYIYNGEGIYAEFTRSGYQTCCVGKMHHPDLYGSMGFQQRHTQEEMQDPDDDYTKFMLNSPYKDVFDYNGLRCEMYYVPQISQLPAEDHPTQWVGDNSVDFLKNCDADQPFFLMSSFIHPHPPFAPPAPWNKMYRTVSDDPYMPEKPEDFKSFMSDRFVTDSIGVSRQDLSLLRNYYYACVSFVDYQISRMLQVLKDRGLYDNTIIVFSSDHGEMLGDFGTMGKRSMLEGAAHIPLMMKIPGQAHAHRSEVCSLVDIAPTLFNRAGISYEQEEFDGVDLFGSSAREEVYSQYSTGAKGTYMVATNRDKLVWSGPYQQYFYFNTKPEDRNKYDPANPRVAELQKKLQAYMDSDVGTDGSGATDAVSGASKFPYGPKRADHVMRHDDELARMPAGYPIAL